MPSPHVRAVGRVRTRGCHARLAINSPRSGLRGQGVDRTAVAASTLAFMALLTGMLLWSTLVP